MSKNKFTANEKQLFTLITEHMGKHLKVVNDLMRQLKKIPKVKAALRKQGEP